MTLTNLYIQNFRKIGEEGATITISPVTFMTGCNSAGKSSAAKAFLLLASFLKDVKDNNGNLVNTPLDFSKVVKLGTFDTVLNVESRAKGIDHFMIGYDWDSYIFTKKIKAFFTFGTRDSDLLNQGWLKEISIYIGSDLLFTVFVGDNNLSIKIDDNNKLLDYYRYYMLKQIASAHKYANVELYYNKKDPDYVIDDLAANILSLDLSELLRTEQNLQENGILKDCLEKSGFNKECLRGLTQFDIRCILDYAFGDLPLDNLIYNFEQTEKRRCGDTDIISLFDEARSKDEMLHYIYSDDCTLGILEDHKIKVLSYIQSNSSNVIEYKREHNNDLVLYIENMINDQLKQFKRTSFKDVDQISTGIMSFLGLVFRASINPTFCQVIGYADSSNVEVKRLYPLDLSDKFGNLWKQFNKISDENLNNYYHGDFMRYWLKELGIGNDILVENIEGVLRIKLISPETPEGRLLADYGYGITQLVALLLNIELAISRVNDKFISFVGDYGDEDYGLSFYPSFLILEEPEVHLHPMLQSKLADMFLDASKHGVRIIAETHSEYMIRRSQVIVADQFSKNPEYIPQFKVYYFPAEGEPYDMGYQKNGHFIESFGSGFFDEACKWTRKLIRSNWK